MENTALLLIIVTLFLLVILVGLLSVIVFKLMNQKPASGIATNQPATGEAPHPDVSKTEYHPEILKRIKDLEKLRPKKAHLFCPNHTEEPGEVTCAICERFFCKACIKPFKALHFCKEHIPLVMRHEWDEVLTLKTSTADPENGVRLYDVKKEIFEKSDIPTYIETHYKINVDQDYIETYLVLYSIREKVQELKSKLAEHEIY